MLWPLGRIETSGTSHPVTRHHIPGEEEELNCAVARAAKVVEKLNCFWFEVTKEVQFEILTLFFVGKVTSRFVGRHFASLKLSSFSCGKFAAVLRNNKKFAS